MLNEQDRIWQIQTAKRIVEKMNQVSERSKDKIPYTTNEGIHDDKSSPATFAIDNGINWWTNGFWAGIMWLMYEETAEEKYIEIARNTEKKLDRCFHEYYGLHHDVGFMWQLSAVANYRLTGYSEARKRGLHAANLLAGRYNPVGKFLRAWNDIPDDDKDTRGWAIIDCMFNLSLLYWASEETKDPRFKQIAMLHADTVAENFIRADGSVRHIVEFDPFHGGMVRDYGGQGYQDGSSWTRGQAWGLYGFVLSFIHTKKPLYLEISRKIADCFIKSTPESFVIPVDFKQPSEPCLEDSSAAAVAVCGLIELAGLMGMKDGKKYIEHAMKLLRVLEERCCDWTNGSDCILLNCTSSYHSPRHHISIIYGDYFFIEAIWKLKETCSLLW